MQKLQKPFYKRHRANQILSCRVCGRPYVLVPDVHRTVDYDSRLYCDTRHCPGVIRLINMRAIHPPIPNTADIDHWDATRLSRARELMAPKNRAAREIVDAHHRQAESIILRMDGDNPTYLVRSLSGKSIYLVTHDIPNDVWTCDCPDYTYRPTGMCKHITSVIYLEDES